EEPYHRTRRGVHLEGRAGARSPRSGRRARGSDGGETQHSGARSSPLASRCDRVRGSAAHHRAGEGGMTTARTIAAAALDYHARGWKRVPIGRKTKKPIGTGWQKRPFDPAQFNGNAQNVGIQLGAVSGGLADVDLDTRAAIGFAPEFLPSTNAIFGHRSKP